MICFINGILGLLIHDFSSIIPSIIVVIHSFFYLLSLILSIIFSVHSFLRILLRFNFFCPRNFQCTSLAPCFKCFNCFSFRFDYYSYFWPIKNYMPYKIIFLRVSLVFKLTIVNSKKNDFFL